jgi:energy-coupling factor transport system permease protein
MSDPTRADAVSRLHRADPRAKALALAIVLLAVGKSSMPAELAAVTGVVALSALASRYPARRLAAHAPAMATLVAVTVVLNALMVKDYPPALEPLASLGPLRVTRTGLSVGAVAAAKLVLAILATGIFLFTTSPLDLVDAFGEPGLLPRRLRPAWRRTALFLALALRFLPTMRDEMTRIREGQRARGVTLAGGPVARVRDLGALIVPLVLWTVSRAGAVAYALDARGFDAGRERTHLVERRLAAFDAVAVLVPAALLAAVVRMR